MYTQPGRAGRNRRTSCSLPFQARGGAADLRVVVAAQRPPERFHRGGVGRDRQVLELGLAARGAVGVRRVDCTPKKEGGRVGLVGWVASTAPQKRKVGANQHVEGRVGRVDCPKEAILTERVRAEVSLYH
eukprot:1848214-Prymnesium_polylepis.2